MFLVQKKSEGFCPVLDFSRLNLFIEVSHFKKENLGTLETILNPADFMINIDFSGAYLAVAIQPPNITNWQPSKCSSPGFKLLKPVAAWLRGQGIRLIVYLGDFLIITTPSRLRYTNLIRWSSW